MPRPLRRSTLPVLLLVLLGSSWASAGSAQLFELPLSTWGPLETRREDIGPGVVEVIAALLVLEAMALGWLLSLFWRRIRRQKALLRGAPETLSWPGGRIRLLEEKILRVVSWLLAPAAGLVGAFLGHGFTLWGLSVSGLLAWGAVGILALAAACFVIGSRELLLAGRHGSGPPEAEGGRLW